MDYEFRELDESVAQLSADFADISKFDTKSGRGGKQEDPFAEFLTDNMASSFTPDSKTKRGGLLSTQQVDPLDAVLDKLDHITPRGNALDQALYEIDAMIETDLATPLSDFGNQQRHQQQDRSGELARSVSAEPTTRTRKRSVRKDNNNSPPPQPATVSAGRKSVLEIGNRRIQVSSPTKTPASSNSGGNNARFEAMLTPTRFSFDGETEGGGGTSGTSGPLYFKSPEPLVDITDVSVEELQRIVAELHTQICKMAEDANTEIQEHYNRAQTLDEDNLKAVKTIQELQSELHNRQDYWNKSEKNLKLRLQKLESEKQLVKSQSQPSTPGINSASSDIERLKSALRTLNQQKGDLQKQLQDTTNELTTMTITANEHIQEKDFQIQKLKTQIKYLSDEKKALEETFQDFSVANSSTEKLEQYEKHIKSQQVDIDALKREVAALKSEKKILQGQVEQMGRDLGVGGGGGEEGYSDDLGESVPKLKLRIRQLEAEIESGSLKIRRLIAAIKADRTQSEEKIKDVIAERDEQEQRADKFESKMVQLIEMVRSERKKRQDDNTQSALDAARETLRETEIQIRQANEAASAAERALQQKEQELQKVLLFGKKKAREAQNAMEDIKVLEEKSNKLVEALKTLKEENRHLKVAGQLSRSTSLQNVTNVSEELEQANQRCQKLEQAVRKLKQMLSNLEAESADKEKSYEERLKTAENRILAAEERAKNAALLAGQKPSGPPAPPGGPPPPPPPPPPTLKLNYEIKINRTGQSSKIEGEMGKPQNPRNVFVDSIVDAIKKGVTLKKTGLRDYSETGEIVTNNPAKEEDFSVEDAFAAMAREIALNKQKREERNKQQGQNEEQNTKKKGGGELDSLLAELEVLDALVDQ